MNVTLNVVQALYVIPCGDGYSCMGFDNARDHAQQIAAKLRQPGLAFGPGDHATLAGYAKYQAAIAAWACSPLSRETYFDPGTDPKAAQALETCRRNHRKARLMLGDTTTGECWLDEHDVVGHIGRSGGMLKVPLLIEPGACGGTAILTAHLLRIVAWEHGRDLYRHPAFRAPDLSLRQRPDSGGPKWQVLQNGQVVAAFDDIGRAGGYLAFMRGHCIDPRVFR